MPALEAVQPLALPPMTLSSQHSASGDQSDEAELVQKSARLPGDEVVTTTKSASSPRAAVAVPSPGGDTGALTAIDGAASMLVPAASVVSHVSIGGALVNSTTLPTASASTDTSVFTSHVTSSSTCSIPKTAVVHVDDEELCTEEKSDKFEAPAPKLKSLAADVTLRPVLVANGTDTEVEPMSSPAIAEENVSADIPGDTLLQVSEIESSVPESDSLINDLAPRFARLAEENAADVDPISGSAVGAGNGPDDTECDTAQEASEGESTVPKSPSLISDVAPRPTLTAEEKLAEVESERANKHPVSDTKNGSIVSEEISSCLAVAQQQKDAIQSDCHPSHNADLQCENPTLVTELSALKAELNSRVDEQKRACVLNVELARKSASLEAELGQLKRERCVWSTEHTSLKAELAQKNEIHEAVLSRLHGELTVLYEEKDVLTATNDELAELNAALSRDVCRLQQESRSRQDEHTALVARSEELSESMVSLEADIRRLHETRRSCDALETRNAELENKLSKLDTELSRLKEEQCSEHEKFVALTEQKAELEDANSALAAKLSRFAEEKISQKDKYAALESSIAELGGEKSALKNTVRQLQEDLRAQSERNADLAARNGELEQNTATFESTVSELRAKNVDLKEHNAALKMSNAELHSTKEKLHAEISRLKRERRAHDDEYAEVEALRATTKKAVAEANILRAKNSLLEDEVSTHDGEMDTQERLWRKMCVMKYFCVYIVL